MANNQCAVQGSAPTPFCKDRTGSRRPAPSFGGFAGAVSYCLDEVRNPELSATSISASSASGPLSVRLGYLVEELVGTNNKFTRLSASDDLGAAVVKALYGYVTFPASATRSDRTRRLRAAVSQLQGITTCDRATE